MIISIFSNLSIFKDDPERLFLIIIFSAPALIGSSAEKDPRKRLLLRVFFVGCLLISFLFPTDYSAYSEISQTSFRNLILIFLVLASAALLIPFFLFSGNKAYHYAKKGDLESLKKEIEKGSDPAKAHRMSQTTILEVAAQAGYVDIVSFLLSSGVNPNTQDRVGFSPLHVASIHGNAEIVSMLIAAGANVHIRASNGVTPLHWAAGNQPKIVKILIDAKADVNVISSNGMTPLHLAILGKSYDSVVLLVNNGADANIALPDGRLPLEMAIQSQDDRITDFLKCHVRLTN